jgi:hypothetical protein
LAIGPSAWHFDSSLSVLFVRGTEPIMQNRLLVLILLVSAILAGVGAGWVLSTSGGPSGRRVIDGLLAFAYPTVMLSVAFWELRKRRQGKYTAFGRTYWERDQSTPPSPQHFLRVSLIQLCAIPLGIGVPAALRLGWGWFLVPLSCTSLIALAFLINFQTERRRLAH